MASTYTALVQGYTWAASAKVMLNIWNPGATTLQTIKIRRVWLINAQVAAVTGVMSAIVLIQSTSTSGTGVTTITPVKHDTGAGTVINGGVLINTANTVLGTVVNTYRRTLIGSDEPAISTFKIENFYNPATGIIWDAGYGDTNVEPFTLPTGVSTGFQIVSTGTAVGNIDIACEFTVE